VPGTECWQTLNSNMLIISTRCNIYISRLCYDVSVRLSVHLSVMEVHWRIIANLGFKFRYHFTAHCGCRAANSTVAVLLAVLLAGGSSRAMLACARSLVFDWRQHLKILVTTPWPMWSPTDISHSVNCN